MKVEFIEAEKEIEVWNMGDVIFANGSPCMVCWLGINLKYALLNMDSGKIFNSGFETTFGLQDKYEVQTDSYHKSNRVKLVIKKE